MSPETFARRLAFDCTNATPHPRRSRFGGEVRQLFLGYCAALSIAFLAGVVFMFLAS